MKNLLLLFLGLIFTINAFAVGAVRNVRTTIEHFEPITTTFRDLLPTPEQGDVVWNVTTGTLNFYNSGWFDIASMTPSQVTEATQYANAGQNGLLSQTDWSTFNSKLSASALATSIIYVDPVNGSDAPASGRGSAQIPYQTIQAAFDSVPNATTLNQWANGRIDLYLLQGEYNEAPVVFYKRRSVNIIGDGAKVLLDFTLNYDPTAQYTGFVYTQAGLPAPWTGGFASPTLSLGCQNNMNGLESGFTTNCMMFMGRVKFTNPNYTTQTSPNYGVSYVTMNGIEVRGGYQVNDTGTSSNASNLLEMMNSVVSGNNIGLTRAGGVASSFTLKASNSRPASVIGPVAIIGKIDSCRVGKLDRTTDINGSTGIYTTGAIQFTNTTSTSGITNSTFVGTGTQNIGNTTGTANSVMKIDRMSWYQLRALTLDFGGGVTWNITDNEKYLRVVAVNAGSSAINATTDHILLDPASLIASYTVTMPVKPFDGQRVLISSGAFGVTALTLSPSAGQSFASGSAITSLASNSASEYEWNNTTSVWYKVRSSGSSNLGDVVGPISSVDSEVAVFDGVTGKILKSATGSGVAHLLSGVLSASNVDLTSEVSNILPITNGGTGLSAVGTSGNVLTSDGTNWISSPAAISGITSLNSLTDTIQSFANGSSGIAPAFVSATSTHTLNIPLASGLGVTSGTISKTDYDTFNSKQSAGNYITDLTGDVTATGPNSANATIANLAVTNAKIADSTIDLTAKVNGILPYANGGTGINSPSTIYKVLTSNGTNWISDFVDYANITGTPTNVSDFTNDAGYLSTVDLAVNVTGILPTANGGTNVSSAGAIGNVLTSDGTNWISSPNTAGTGDVVGPASSVDSEIALFDGITGKLIKSSTGTGIAHITSGVLSTSNVDLTSEVTGVLPTVNGGTNVSASGVIGNVLTSDGSNWISSALPTFINSMNGLTTTAQYFATSTTGTDFTVSSSIDTHTFNLPVASATNSGKLSNTDWTTFNSKGSATPLIFGTRSAPRNIQTAGITTAGSHMSDSVLIQDIYVCGSSTGASCDSAVTLATINAGTIDGQRLCIVGRDSTNTVTLNGGTTTNIEINGNAVLGAGKTICLRYDLTNWSEVSRNF